MAETGEWTAEDALRMFLRDYPWVAAAGENRRAFDQGVDDAVAGRGSNREEAGTPGLPSSDRQISYRAGYRAGKAIRKEQTNEQ